MTGGSSSAKNRWLVAYTLLRNPSIQELTASRLWEESERGSVGNELVSSVFMNNEPDINI